MALDLLAAHVRRIRRRGPDRECREPGRPLCEGRVETPIRRTNHSDMDALGRALARAARWRRWLYAKATPHAIAAQLQYALLEDSRRRQLYSVLRHGRNAERCTSASVPSLGIGLLITGYDTGHVAARGLVAGSRALGTDFVAVPLFVAARGQGSSSRGFVAGACWHLGAQARHRTLRARLTCGGIILRRAPTTSPHHPTGSHYQKQARHPCTTLQSIADVAMLRCRHVAHLVLCICNCRVAFVGVDAGFPE